MARSHAAGGASAKRTPASRARCSEARASAGRRASSPSQVTTGAKPRCRSCAAASKPSPPLLPGPQAIQIVRACGAIAMASRATARPARCISVCGGSAAAAACSIRRVAATSNSGAVVAAVMRCMAAMVLASADLSAAASARCPALRGRCPGRAPAIRSASTRALPHDSAQPLEPWPRLSQTPGTPLAPMHRRAVGQHRPRAFPLLHAGRAGCAAPGNQSCSTL